MTALAGTLAEPARDGGGGSGVCGGGTDPAVGEGRFNVTLEEVALREPAGAGGSRDALIWRSVAGAAGSLTEGRLRMAAVLDDGWGEAESPALSSSSFLGGCPTGFFILALVGLGCVLIR
jgi:hypothetical protein